MKSVLKISLVLIFVAFVVMQFSAFAQDPKPAPTTEQATVEKSGCCAQEDQACCKSEVKHCEKEQKSEGCKSSCKQKPDESKRGKCQRSQKEHCESSPNSQK